MRVKVPHLVFPPDSRGSSSFQYKQSALQLHLHRAGLYGWQQIKTRKKYVGQSVCPSLSSMCCPSFSDHLGPVCGCVPCILSRTKLFSWKWRHHSRFKSFCRCAVNKNMWFPQCNLYVILLPPAALPRYHPSPECSGHFYYRKIYYICIIYHSYVKGKVWKMSKPHFQDIFPMDS